MKNLLKRAAAFTLASTVLLSATACNAPTNSNVDLNASNQVDALAKKSGSGKWLMLVHLAADNNLYQFGLGDMNEMEAGLASDNVKVVVLFDGAKQGDSAVYEIEKDPAGMNKNLISKKVAVPFIPSSNEIDSGDYKVAAKFVDWAVDKYASSRDGGDINVSYTVWNHGLDWQRARNSFVSKPAKNGVSKASNEISTNEFAWDDNGTNMKTADLNPILDPAVKKMGKKFDILNFDACLMAHAEVAYQVKDTVDYMVASQKTEPGEGNPYHLIVKSISANPSMSGLEASKVFVADYNKSYPQGGITLSSMDISSVAGKFSNSLNKFADAMVANLGTDNAALQEIRKKTVVFENNDCADISHFASMVAKDARVSAAVKKAAEDVVADVSATVLANANSASANAKGISLYFPYKGLSYKTRYDSLKFSTNKWDEFLKAFIK